MSDRAGNVNFISVTIEHICTFVDGVCTICGKKDYIDFTITKENMYMCGIDYDQLDIAIPRTFVYEEKKYKVCKMDTFLFNNCQTLKSVTIPNSIEQIAAYAFRTCKSLITVNIENGVKQIAYNAFENCTSLENINIPDSVELIASNAFKDVPHITYHGTAEGAPWGALSVN